MSLKYIKTGNRVEISVKDENDKNIRYTSLVEENYGDGRLLLYIPMMYGKIIKLPIDEKYYFEFFTEMGIIKYNVVIKEYVYIDDFNFMIAEIDSEVEKIQRREHFRINCVLPLKFTEIFNVYYIEKESDFLIGTIKDLGEGGIRFLSNENIEIGEKFKFYITLNDECAMVNGRILHKQEYPKSNFKYQYRANFFDVKEEEKNKILKFIFFEQRFNIRQEIEEMIDMDG